MWGIGFQYWIALLGGFRLVSLLMQLFFNINIYKYINKIKTMLISYINNINILV